MRDGCPAPRVLEAFAAGDEFDDAIQSHVRGCGECRAMVDEIRENQRFLHSAGSALANTIATGLRTQPTPRGVPGFELLAEIGRGGQGVVFRGVQCATKRPAAVKMLLAGGFATKRQENRFEREIEIASRLRHPNIVSIFESGIAGDGRRFVAMEYVEGKPLDQFVRVQLAANAGRQRIERTLQMCASVASAVGHAHANGVIHRDLKPSNILVDAAGQPHVLDFGLARELNPMGDTTVSREFAGTPAFAAPEQFDGDIARIDARTDVYSLGVLMYVALTGTHPYPCDVSLPVLIEHVRSTTPVPPSAHVSNVSADVDTIVLKALSKDAERRYSTAQALATDIEDCLAGRAISARRDSTLYVLRKLAQRHRAIVAIGGMALLLVFAAAIGLGLLSSRLDAQRRIAEAALSESNLQRGRLLAKTGDVLRAEQMLWRAARDAGVIVDDNMGLESTPTARQASWALLELYASLPKVRTLQTGGKISEISFDEDGRGLRSAHADGVIEHWSLDGVRLSRSPGLVPAGSSGAVAMSRDLSRAVHLGASATLSSFDVDSATRIAGPIDVQHKLVRYALSDDGRMFAYVDPCGGAAVLDTDTLTPLVRFTDDVCHVSMSGPFLFLAINTPSRTDVRVHSVFDWTQTTTLHVPRFSSYDSPVLPASVSPDGRLVLVPFEANLLMYDAIAGGNPIAIRNGTSPNGRPVYAADGRLAVSATNDGTMTIWSMPELRPRQVLRTMASTRTCAMRGEYAAIANLDGTIAVWDVGDSNWPRRFRTAGRSVHGVALSADETMLAAVDDAGRLALFDMYSDESKSDCANDEGEVVRAIDFTPSLQRFVTVGTDGAVREWSEQGVLLGVVATEVSDPHCVRYSDDGNWVAAGSRDGRIYLWSTADAGSVTVLTGHSSRVPQLEFSPDSRLLASVADSGDASLWDVHTGTRLRSYNRKFNATRTITFSPDGKTLAIGADDRTIHFWDVETGKLLRVMPGMPWGTFDTKYHPSGRVLFAVGRGGEIVVVDPEACTELATFKAHERLVFALELSSDGRRLITAGEDDWIGIWNLDHLRNCAKGNSAHNLSRLDDQAAVGTRTTP